MSGEHGLLTLAKLRHQREHATCSVECLDHQIEAQAEVLRQIQLTQGRDQRIH
jgi:hypothetical protein